MGDGVHLKVRTNLDDVFAQADAFVAQCKTIAAPRALNKLRDQAATVGFRKIAEIYRLPKSQVEKYVTLGFARSGALEATITLKGRGFPLYVFQPRQTRKGVTVMVKGRRVLIPGAFIATLRSGRTGVFARGAYGGKSSGFQSSGRSFGRFQFGKSRLPINEFYTFAPPDTLRNEQVQAAMSARLVEQAPKVFAQEARFLARSGSK